MHYQPATNAEQMYSLDGGAGHAGGMATEVQTGHQLQTATSAEAPSQISTSVPSSQATPGSRVQSPLQRPAVPSPNGPPAG
jgi:hypothetical protein